MLSTANENLKPYGKSISVNDYEDDGNYTCEIRDRKGKVILYAECFYEENLPEIITNAWNKARTL